MDDLYFPEGSEEAFAYPPKLIPEIFHWDNYEKAMTALPFGKAYLNSLKLAVINVTGQVLTSLWRDMHWENSGSGDQGWCSAAL